MQGGVVVPQSGQLTRTSGTRVQKYHTRSRHKVNEAAKGRCSKPPGILLLQNTSSSQKSMIGAAPYLQVRLAGLLGRRLDVVGGELPGQQARR